jgi:hypothetical protein
MEVHFTPDVQEKLAHSAAKQGRDAEEQYVFPLFLLL